VHTEKREGLIRARQIGARYATADVMIFLDAHSEANYNWLPPLIEPIALDYRTTGKQKSSSGVTNFDLPSVSIRRCRRL
jgi:hypothetical protein